MLQNIPQILKMAWFHSKKKQSFFQRLFWGAGWWTRFHPGSDEVYVVSAVTQLIQAEVHFPREWSYFEQDVGCCKLGRWYVDWCDCVCVMHYRYFDRFFVSIKYNVIIFVCAPHFAVLISRKLVLNHAFIVKCFLKTLHLSPKTGIIWWYFTSQVRRQAAAIHSSLLESCNFDGNEGMQAAVQRVQDLEKQLLDRIHVFVFFWKEKT